MLFMLSAIEADRARLADIEAQILHLERSRSGFPLIPTMLSAFGAERARVADMEAQMRHLERTLSQLHAEKALVQERLDSYTYPVLTLPNEIMSEIFLQFLPVYPHCPPLTGSLSPTFLTKICHQWRDVALTTPELWRAIRLSGNTIPSERQSHIANIWLIRSGNCPLSIHINDWIHTSKMVSALISALAVHRARWDYLRLDLLHPPPPSFQTASPSSPGSGT
jgi:hypothetical protein